LDHYGTEDLTGRIEEAIRAITLSKGSLEMTDLAPLDQFHARGLEATEELVGHLDLPDGAAFLDVGCGLGGPARYLASQGCWRVTGVDLNPAYIHAAQLLSERTRLAERLTFQQANALDLPFPDASFDGAWTLQVAMNIQDRPALYRSIHRVLKPGGTFAVYTVVAGSGPLRFPVPWARTQETSFLLGAETLRAVLVQAGFRVVDWTDKTRQALDWFTANGADSFSKGESPLALKLVMGPGFPGMVANFNRNLAEGRAGLVQGILRRT
jgi:SAM-dependent methyltransferase